MLKTEARALVQLAWPLLIAQLTHILMGVSDTIMAGQYTATDMAAIAVGFSFINPIQFFIQGIAFALPPIIARLQGAKQSDSVANDTQQVGYLLLCIVAFVLIFAPFVRNITQLIPIADELRPITSDYVVYMFWSFPAFALYQWLRNYAEGLGQTKPTMIIMMIGLGVNVLANYALIYGKFGFPEMGGAGCGLATAAVFYAMLVANIAYVYFSKKLAPYHLFKTFYRPQLNKMMAAVKLGLPIAMTILFEVSLFALVAILLAPYGTVEVASHQIALNFSSFVFMFPMSMGMAVAIRVSFRIGEQNFQLARHTATAALIISLSIAIVTALITVLARDWIVQLYTQDQIVFGLAAHLLILGALFQISDSIQVISANALRGYKDTTAMFLITFVAYWLIGLPIGITLGITNLLTDEPMKASGFWIGFISGLTAAAIMLKIRLVRIQNNVQNTL